MAVDERILTGPRWSSAVLCPRQAVYQGLGTEGIPPTPEMERIFRRGRFIGDAVAADVIQTYRDDGIEAIAEQEVPWPRQNPVGTGHADIYIPSESHVVEVVSRKDGDLPGHKVLQVAGYALNLGAERASVLSIDPSTYSERAYPVELESFRDKVSEIETAVVAGLDGVMPERAGEHPGSFPCFTCPFRRVCWEGVELPPAGRLEKPDHVEILRRLAQIEDDLSIATGREKELKAEQAELREELRPHLPDGADVIASGIRVKVTPVAGRLSLNLSAAEKAGHSVPDKLLPFLTTGKGYDRWTIKRTGA